MSDVAAIEERLLRRAHVYDDPGSYAAGVRAALRAIAGEQEELAVLPADAAPRAGAG